MQCGSNRVKLPQKDLSGHQVTPKVHVRTSDLGWTASTTLDHFLPPTLFVYLPVVQVMLWGEPIHLDLLPVCVTVMWRTAVNHELSISAPSK